MASMTSHLLENAPSLSVELTESEQKIQDNIKILRQKGPSVVNVHPWRLETEESCSSWRYKETPQGRLADCRMLVVHEEQGVPNVDRDGKRQHKEDISKMDVPPEKTETLDDESNLEGEDFFCRLTDEEKECLQYLLETIDSLDQDEDENANNDPDTKQDLDRNHKGLTESLKQSDKTEHDPSPSKMKIVKSFSEDSPGLSITVTPDTGQKSTGSHPNHLRKFDTIMRSGVNVQELRARFIRQQGDASFEDAFKETELSSSSKQVPQVTHNRMSPRQEALQKLGLLKINQTKTNTPEELHGTSQNSAVKNYEINQNHSKAGSNLPQSFERKPGAFEKVWPP